MALTFISPGDPAVIIDGTEHKFYTENNPPPTSSSGGESGVSGGRLIKSTRFTSSGVFSVQPETKYCIVKMQAAGGGSSGAYYTGGKKFMGGCGGGGGCYLEYLIVVNEDNPLVDEPVTVGSYGAGGISPGTKGGDIIFNGITCPGGARGLSSVSTASPPYSSAGLSGASGLPTGDNLINENIIFVQQGGQGQGPIILESLIIGGRGGCSHSAAGGGPGIAFGTTAQSAMSLFSSDQWGAGGGGTARIAEANLNGASGAPGCMVIMEYA